MSPARKPPLRDLSDGLITGTVVTTGRVCGNCGEKTYCVHIDIIALPEGLTPSTSLIPYKVIDHDEDRGVRIYAINYLGIGCGCYAKFHRQIAHITTLRKKK